MRKKRVLTTLIMLSLLQGSVYADPVSPGVYNDKCILEITDDGNTRTIINQPGTYNFKSGLSIDRDNINEIRDRDNSIIGLVDDAENGDKTLEIIIGDENADSDKFELNLNSNSQKYKNNTLIQVGGNGNNYKNIIKFNLKNADMHLGGSDYYAAIASRDFYSSSTTNTNGNIEVIGDGNSDLFIGGNMQMGVYSSGTGELIIKGIDNFVINKNTAYYEEGQKFLSDDIAAISVHSAKTYIETNNLIIQGENLDDDKNAFYTGIKIGSDTVPVNDPLELVVNDNIKVYSTLFGIYNGGNTNITTNNILIDAKQDIISDPFWGQKNGGGEGIVSTGILNLTAKNNIYIKGESNGINLERCNLKSTSDTDFNKQIGNTNITSKNGNIIFIGENGAGIISETQSYQDGIRTADFKAKDLVNIYGKQVGIGYQPGSRNLSITSELSNVNIISDDTAFNFDIENFSTPTVRTSNVRGIANIKAEQGSINILGKNNGLLLDNIDARMLKGNYNFYKTGCFATVNVNAEKSINFIGESEYGVKISNSLSNTQLDIEVPNDIDKSTNLNVTSQGTIDVSGGKVGIMATAVKDKFDNNVLNTVLNKDFGSKVNLTATGDVTVQGGDYGVIAFENSTVDIKSANGNVLIGATDTNGEKSSNSAAVYAENGANTQSTVNINADNGVVTVLSGNKGLWASGKGGTINVNGAVNINANYFNGEQLTRSNGDDVHLAIVAGLKSKDEVQNVEGLVDINLKGDVTSNIYGDIVGARSGKVDISRDSGNGSLIVTGDVLAGNGGEVNLDIGKNGILTGRIDDYMDASAEHGNSFFAPQFSYEIENSGTVNLELGEGSRWNVNGQSWVTEINAADSSIIDLTGVRTDRNTSAHALTVGTLNGNANFRMNLDGFDKANSDMLYIKNSNGEYNVILDDAVTTAEIGKTGLRFATIDNADVNFKNVVVYNAGAFDVKYKVGKDAYVNHNENDIYNGGTDFDEVKPGTEAVDEFFDDKEAETLINDESKITNYKIIDVHSRKLNDTGKTIANMSRANYSNAIYMDRLNKRLGEARYINGEEDEGMWVRIRHDRIGKDDAFRSQNTMYELGYDEKQDCDNGKRYVGFAIDYMHGDTGYTDVSGKGEIDRYGLWLYDTWLGDKGHYADYVVKWGHLSNDFEVYTMNEGKKVNGDYSNNVFSISAEYGRKKDIGNDWYFEPQVQAQLARVTGADYETSQGTQVSVDGINSLIGRAGFRIGKDFGADKQSTVYLKADVLHEFLGDQDISLKDKTSDGNWSTISYENDGTWYDVGFGFATALGKNSYAFMDFEKSFGNDNDETYQINAGVQWNF